VDNFAQLLFLRWEEAQKALGLSPGHIKLTWEISDNYDHFHTTRGYGVTMHQGGKCCHLVFATKILDADKTRQDGIIRHEIGHVLDMCIPARSLNEWALDWDVQLPPQKQAEIRADKIAEAVWGEPIFYDKPHHIQSTCCGVSPRPAYLGA
jgi:hypothetical protein